MPAPLVQPAMRTVLPPTRQVAAAHFGRVSVVRIACANSRNERVEPRPARARRGIAARIFSAGKGTPITPVEHTKTSCGVMPSSAAARRAVARAAVIPAGPTEQFALPEFTTTARRRPFAFRRCLRQSTTGAACTRFVVKTAAAEAGSSLTSMPRSSAPVFFNPHAVAAKRNPRGNTAGGCGGLMPRLPIARA